MRAQSSRGADAGFTVLELLIVVAIIIVLVGLILATSGYVQKKGARSRTEAEIAAISAALENYKADNGIYPRGKSVSTPLSGTPSYSVAATGTDDLDPRVDVDLDANLKKYQDACRYLYEQLTGDTDLDLSVDTGNKSYFTFKESMLGVIKDSMGKTIGLSHIKDAFGNSYGYSTANQSAPVKGYNPTYDLWSTATSTDPNQWIKNW